MLEDEVRQDIAEALSQRASELYGPRARRRHTLLLEQMAEHLWLLSTKAPSPEVEPVFFM